MKTIERWDVFAVRPMEPFYTEPGVRHLRNPENHVEQLLIDGKGVRFVDEKGEHKLEGHSSLWGAEYVFDPARNRVYCLSKGHFGGDINPVEFLEVAPKDNKTRLAILRYTRRVTIIGDLKKKGYNEVATSPDGSILFMGPEGDYAVVVQDQVLPGLKPEEADLLLKSKVRDLKMRAILRNSFGLDE